MLTEKEVLWKRLSSQHHILELKNRQIKQEYYEEQVALQRKLMNQIKEADLKSNKAQNKTSKDIITH